MATAEAPTVPACYSARIRASLDGLEKYGVTEEQVRVKANLSPAEWERITQSPDDVNMLHLFGLAEALFLDFTFLLTGDRGGLIQFSPCSWTSIIRSAYPEIEA